MKHLTDIGIKYGTDKATGHGYTEFYHDYLAKFENPTLLEIGIYDGASLKMWEEFYNYKCNIVGVDIIDKTEFSNQNTKIIVADQSYPDDLAAKCKNVYSEYDIIIDDGSHIVGHQISALATLFPILKSGGVYILEDLHTSFVNWEYNKDNAKTTAYDLVYRLTKGLDIETQYATEDEIKYLVENVAEAKLYMLNENDYYHSITSVIIKK
jgi:demethylmacrocin O-methyltransferase